MASAPLRDATRLSWRGGQATEGHRAIPEEVAVALTFDATTHAVMMATPADLEDFAIGFSLAEGIIASPAEVTGIEPSEVTAEKSFVDDLDIDSLSMVEIAVQTEDKYGVKIPDEDLAGLRTVGDVVAYIQKLEEENPEAAAALRDKFGDK